MAIKVVRSSSIHYLKREELLQSGDLIRIGGDQGSVVISNPFKYLKGEQAEDEAIVDLNNFLLNVAPHVAFNLMPRKNRPEAKFEVFGSYNFSNSKPQIVLANSGRRMPEDITFIGSVGEQLKEYIPARLHDAFEAPNIHIVKSLKLGVGTKLTNSTLADKPLPELSRSTLINEIVFWSNPNHFRCVEHFICPDDARLMLGKVEEVVGSGVGLAKFVDQSIIQVGKRKSLLTSANVNSYNALHEKLKHIASQKIDAKKFNLFLKKDYIGQIQRFNETGWSFTAEKGKLIPFNTKQSALLPAFLANLMPEGTGEVRAVEYEEFFNEENNFMGDLCIRRLGSTNPPTSAEIKTPLSSHIDVDNIYTGLIKNIGVQYADKYQSIALKEKGMHNRISGFADKVSVKLDIENGKAVLQPTDSGDDFTHIFKFPNDVEKENLETCEWFGMHLASKVGLPVPSFALVPNTKSICVDKEENDVDLLDEAFDAIEVSSSLSKILYSNDDEHVLEAGKPNYVIERFDVSEPGSNKISIGEDFASIMGVSPNAKYNPFMENVVEHVKKQSTDWDFDRGYLLRILTLNMLINNNDLHIKNITMLRVYDKSTHELLESKLSPAYDIVSVDPNILTGRYRVSPKKHALKVAGSNDYSFENLISFAEDSLDYTADEARTIVANVCKDSMVAASKLLSSPPDLLKVDDKPNKELSSLCHFVEENYDLYFGRYLNIDKSDIYDIPDEVDIDYQMTYL